MPLTVKYGAHFYINPTTDPAYKADYQNYKIYVVHASGDLNPGEAVDDELIQEWSNPKDAVIRFVEIGVEIYGPPGEVPEANSFAGGMIWFGGCQMLTSSVVIGKKTYGGIGYQVAQTFPDLHIPLVAGNSVYIKCSRKNTSSTNHMYIDVWFRIHYVQKP